MFQSIAFNTLSYDGVSCFSLFEQVRREKSTIIAWRLWAITENPIEHEIILKLLIK